jgi:hypothetical protein
MRLSSFTPKIINIILNTIINLTLDNSVGRAINVSKPVLRTSKTPKMENDCILWHLATIFLLLHIIFWKYFLRWSRFFLFVCFFLVEMSFELELHVCKAGALPPSHTSSPFCSSSFGDGNLVKYLPRLASNCDPSDPSLPSR